jgi:DNA-binding MarR family transcriptional regulator
MSQHPEQDLFLLLHDVARLVRVEADRRARLQDMTRAQWALLLKLERNPGLSQKEVADLLEVEPISVARLVDRLEANGLIERRPDASDRRIWRLHLLEAAMSALDQINLQRAELAALISANIPQAVHDAMVLGLRQMKTNIMRMPGAAVPGVPAPGAAAPQTPAPHLKEIA